jgi:hypothetical protein
MKKRKMGKNSTIIIFVAQRGIDVSMLFHNAVIIGMKLIYVKRKNKIWSLITKLNHKKQS